MLKVFGTYMITDAFSLGGYVRAQSGTPWDAASRTGTAGTAC